MTRETTGSPPEETSSGTISDLQAAIGRLEAEKLRIDEQHSALVMSLRYFENLERITEPPRERTKRSTDRHMRDVMADILAAQGPLHRRDVYDRLVERGVHIGGLDPVNNVGAHLSIDPRFTNVGGGMWDLAERADTGQPDDRDADDQHDSDEEDSVPW